MSRSHACDVGDHRRYPGQLLIPGPVDWLAGQCEGRHRRRNEPFSPVGGDATLGRDALGLVDQRRVEQLTLVEKPIDATPQAGVERTWYPRWPALT